MSLCSLKHIFTLEESVLGLYVIFQKNTWTLIGTGKIFTAIISFFSKKTCLIFSLYSDDTTLEVSRYYDAVMTKPAIFHNPHMPGAESQKQKLKSGWKCMLSLRIFQPYASSKTGFAGHSALRQQLEVVLTEKMDLWQLKCTKIWIHETSAKHLSYLMLWNKKDILYTCCFFAILPGWFVKCPHMI